MTPKAGIASSSLHKLLIGLALVAVALSQGIYALGWDNGFVSDDWVLLYRVSKVNTASQLLALVSFDTPWFVRPLQWVATFLLHSSFGVSPFGFHLASQVLDAFNSVLVGSFAFQVLSFCRGQRGSRNLVWSAAVALLFLFSWRHHEAVYWHSASNELLAAAFRLISLNAVAWWLWRGSRYGRVWVISTVAAGLAVMSKESSLVLPLETMLVVAFWSLVSRGRGSRWQRGALIAASQIMVVGTWAYFYVSTSNLGTTGISRGGLTILEATVVEWPLRFVQFLNGNFLVLRSVEQNVLAHVLVFLILCVVTVFAGLRRQWLWLFSLAWSVLAVSSYVGVGYENAVGPVLERGIGGDRYLYYSAAPISLLLVASLLFIDQRLASRPALGRLGPGYYAVCIVLLAWSLGANARMIRALERDWHAAGEIVERTLREVVKLRPSPEDTDVMCFIDLPIHVRGRYAFQNGVAESLFVSYGRDDFAVELYGSGPRSAWGMRCTLRFKYLGSDRGLVQMDR